MRLVRAPMKFDFETLFAVWVFAGADKMVALK
jgi:hypothetical protein